MLTVSSVFKEIRSTPWNVAMAYATSVSVSVTSVHQPKAESTTTMSTLAYGFKLKSARRAEFYLPHVELDSWAMMEVGPSYCITSFYGKIAEGAQAALSDSREL